MNIIEKSKESNKSVQDFMDDESVLEVTYFATIPVEIRQQVLEKMNEKIMFSKIMIGYNAKGSILSKPISILKIELSNIVKNIQTFLTENNSIECETKKEKHSFGYVFHFYLRESKFFEEGIFEFNCCF